MFYGVRLLFCTYKEGTVIREQLVAGEKKEYRTKSTLYFSNTRSTSWASECANRCGILV